MDLMPAFCYQINNARESSNSRDARGSRRQEALIYFVEK